MTDVARLESIAQQLAARIRDDDPERVWAWLAAELPNPGDWFRLAILLAIAVPDPGNRRWWDMTEWARTPEEIALRQHMRRQALINATRRRHAA